MDSRETLKIGELSLTLIRKDVRNVHLSVHPPDGRVTLVAPHGTRPDVARAYAISRLGWIVTQRAQLAAQERETPRTFVTRESHWLWGRRYLLVVEEVDAPPRITQDHRHLRMTVRPGSSAAQRQALLHAFQRAQLHQVIPPLIAKWEAALGVRVQKYFLQRMKTRWGSCNPGKRHIRLNTELVKKPRDLLDYVVLHEMAHLIDPTHGRAFQELLHRHCPNWRDHRAELNALPLGVPELPNPTP